MDEKLLKEQAEIIEDACVLGDESVMVDIEIDGDIEELIKYYKESTQLCSDVSFSWDFICETTREDGSRRDCYELTIEY